MAGGDAQVPGERDQLVLEELRRPELRGRIRQMLAVPQRSFDQIDFDPTVYHTMNGPSEFHVVGSLKSWDITDRLHEITTPTLLVSGRHDEATPLIVGQIHERIAGSQWALFEESSHMPHIEEHEAFIERVDDFLRSID